MRSRVLPTLEGTFDFVFLDALKPDYLKYLKALEPKLKPGATLVADNVIDYAKQMPDFLEYIQSSPLYDTVIIRASLQKNDGASLDCPPHGDYAWIRMSPRTEARARSLPRNMRAPVLPGHAHRGGCRRPPHVGRAAGSRSRQRHDAVSHHPEGRHRGDGVRRVHARRRPCRLLDAPRVDRHATTPAAGLPARRHRQLGEHRIGTPIRFATRGRWRHAAKKTTRC